MVTVDGQEVIAFRGESVAALLFAEGKLVSRYSERNTVEPAPGFFCGMGICFGCMVKVNGRLRRACVTEVEADMEILTQPIKLKGS